MEVELSPEAGLPYHGIVDAANQGEGGRGTKVLYLITKATSGGAQQYVQDLALHARESGLCASLAYGVEGRLAHTLGAAGIQTHALPSLRRDLALISDIRSFFDILTILKSGRPDVLHLNSSKAAGLGALAAKLMGVPRVICTIHGWPFKEDRGSIARAGIRLASWLTAILCDRIIVVSRADLQLGRSMWGIARKVVYIPLGRQPVAPRPPHEAFVAMFGSLRAPALSPETRRLVSIAELTPNKGLRYAIEAIAHLTENGFDCVYVIAGEGEERAKLESLIRARGLRDRIFLPGFVDEAARNLSGFDVFILPSLKEGSPYALIEAAAAGLRIVTTTAVDEALVRDIRAKAVAPKNSLALADAIAELSTLPRSEGVVLDTLPDMLSRTYALYAPAARPDARNNR